MEVRLRVETQPIPSKVAAEKLAGRDKKGIKSFPSRTNIFCLGQYISLGGWGTYIACNEKKLQGPSLHREEAIMILRLASIFHVDCICATVTVYILPPPPHFSADIMGELHILILRKNFSVHSVAVAWFCDTLVVT
jgi:hypothetical protein